MTSLEPSSPQAMLCFSHLRWNFVFQRPHHLMTRAASDRRVYYIEEPLYAAIPEASLQVERCDGITVAIPHLPTGCDSVEALRIQRSLIDDLLARERITRYTLWYYTPMALAFTDHLRPDIIVYDCMDELSAFVDAPKSMRAYERQLLRVADVVFTGGQSLYEAKRGAHPNVHAFPSSVDVVHFAQAHQKGPDPVDQAPIGRPRLGFFGVIDERMDLALVRGVSQARPDWQLVMIGPMVKIDPALLPKADNIHYLGTKSYAELPHYIAGWDVALLPFARNEATRYISPTKTPEYLAAGKPVVSTSIRDVVRPYGEQRLVWIADSVSGFVAACESALTAETNVRLCRADALLAHMSWDRTWMRMGKLIDDVVQTGLAVASFAPSVAAPGETCSTT